MAELQGYCDERFAPLREAFAAGFEDGLELGAALAITHHGKLVVDLWGGFADRKRTQSWQRDTIVNVYSTTKTALNLCALRLIDQGAIEADAPICTYWPEMGRDGKERITVKHVMLQSAGLPGLSEPQPHETLYDWEKMIHLLEREPLWFEPGSAHAYHAQTYGYLLGEVIRRVSREMPGDYFRRHIAVPLDIDLHIGALPESEDHRVAQQYVPTGPDNSDASPFRLKVMRSFGPGNWATRESRAAQVPGTNGIGNARSFARMGAILAMGGELDGVRILSRETIEYATREHARGEDLMMEATIVRGLGYAVESSFFHGITSDCFFWGGFGGSICSMDMKREISFSYTPNLLRTVARVGRGDALARIARPILEALDD